MRKWLSSLRSWFRSPAGYGCGFGCGFVAGMIALVLLIILAFFALGFLG